MIRQRNCVVGHPSKGELPLAHTLFLSQLYGFRVAFPSSYLCFRSTLNQILLWQSPVYMTTCFTHQVKHHIIGLHNSDMTIKSLMVRCPPRSLGSGHGACLFRKSWPCGEGSMEMTQWTEMWFRKCSGGQINWVWYKSVPARRNRGHGRGTCSTTRCLQGVPRLTWNRAWQEIKLSKPAGLKILGFLLFYFGFGFAMLRNLSF